MERSHGAHDRRTTGSSASTRCGGSGHASLVSRVWRATAASDSHFGGDADRWVDAVPCKNGQRSSILRLSTNMRLVRDGSRVKLPTWITEFDSR
jgi:hypothetical protein